MEEDRNALDEVLDALQALIVSNLRIYDMLLMLGSKINPENTKNMINLHEAGKLYGPKLWLDGDESQSTEG